MPRRRARLLQDVPMMFGARGRVRTGTGRSWSRSMPATSRCESVKSEWCHGAWFPESADKLNKQASLIIAIVRKGEGEAIESTRFYLHTKKTKVTEAPLKFDETYDSSQERGIRHHQTVRPSSTAMSDTAVNESDASANHPDISVDDSAPMGKRKRAPRRILHFSDGTLEEYSSDEDEADSKNVTEVSSVDPRGLEWGPWLLYQASVAGSRTLEVCDYLGESLANFFGITTPKYQYEIEEYHRMVAEEEEAQKKMDLEMGGWSSPSDLKLGPVNEQQQVIPQRLWTHGQQGSAV